jgi:predicted short-subunit dehydrogenase-like oxidoreductase (DUF2520 family)
MRNDTTFSLVGPGRLGSTLLYNLAVKGWECRCVVSRKPEKAGGILKNFPVQTSFTQEKDIGTNLFISVNDDAIASVAKNLSEMTIDFHKVRCFHFSGALSSDVLEPLKKKGAATGSLHPLYSFPIKPEIMPKNILFTFEGDDICHNTAVELTHDLDAKLLHIDKSSKTLYHCASVLGGNMSMTLLYIAAKLFTKALSDDREGHKQALIVLVRSALRNLENSTWEDGITGPISRGDEKTIEKHLSALTDFGDKELIELYNILKNLTQKMLNSND